MGLILCLALSLAAGGVKLGLPVALLAGCGGGDDGSGVIAKVGSREITAEYYEGRLVKLEKGELPRGDDRQILDMSQLEGKREFVQTLVNKEIMAMRIRLAILTGVALFAVGVVKTVQTRTNPIWSGTENLGLGFIGGFVFASAYAIACIGLATVHAFVKPRKPVSALTTGCTLPARFMTIES